VSPATSKNIWPYVAMAVGLIAAAALLHLEGRLWWCASCPGTLFTREAWSSQTSQLFLDPYSLTHLLHGLAFGGLLTLLIRNLSGSWRLGLAVLMESAWELIENSNTVIQRYREATAALGYQGDTVVNSLGDIVCCAIGFMLARKLGWWRSLILFFATELVLLVWIRDSLLLEIIMLIHPVNAIKAWQVV
jgi:uncharacterized membrane protein YjdF